MRRQALIEQCLHAAEDSSSGYALTCDELGAEFAAVPKQWHPGFLIRRVLETLKCKTLLELIVCMLCRVCASSMQQQQTPKTTFSHRYNIF